MYISQASFYVPTEIIPNKYFTELNGLSDDWIVEQVKPHEIVITADIPLAAQCLEKGAYVLGHKGRVFTEESIGDALASRDVSSQ